MSVLLSPSRCESLCEVYFCISSISFRNKLVNGWKQYYVIIQLTTNRFVSRDNIV